jgi:hypothetical protein
MMYADPKQWRSLIFHLLVWKGGSLKRSLGMAFPVWTIPKAFGFEAATR